MAGDDDRNRVGPDGLTDGINGILQPRQGRLPGQEDLSRAPAGGRNQAGVWGEDPAADLTPGVYRIASDFTPLRDIEERSSETRALGILAEGDIVIGSCGLEDLVLPADPWEAGADVVLVADDGQRAPFGSTQDIAPAIVPNFEWGMPGIGGPIVTAGGLIFIGAAIDDYLRAFDIETGKELWRGRLPAGGQATPMTYLHNGEQFVVIAAGGHPGLGSTQGDYVVAFRRAR